MSSLYHRLAFVLLGVFLLLASLLFLLYESSTKHLQLETSQKLHLHLAEYLVQEIKLFKKNQLDIKRVKEAFSKVMHIDPATELYIIDPKGKVLAYDAPDEKIKQYYIDLHPIKRFLKHPDKLPIVGDDPRSIQQKVFSVAPIYKNIPYHGTQSLVGYLYIIIEGELYDSIATTIKENKTWRHGLFLIDRKS
ncbi:MAG TPA: sensor histidine kinase, partial [Thiothrix sp.]|nr:sensor histidine kinase [Thiothrix sp.]